MRFIVRALVYSGNCGSLQVSCKLVGLEVIDLWVWFLFIFQKVPGHSTVLSSDCIV